LLNGRLDLLTEGLAFVGIMGHNIVPLAILMIFLAPQPLGSYN
jgi:hypothetical protein